MRRGLGIEAGDRLDARVEGGNIVLVPLRKAKRKPRIKISKATGMPVMSLGPNAVKITSESVRDMLADFP